MPSFFRRLLSRILPSLLVLGLAVAPAAADFAPWNPTAPAAPAIFELIHDPSDPDVVWAGGDPGVLRSDDGGATWSRRSDGLGFTSRVESLAVDPDDPDQLWATISLGEVFRSFDGGLLWRLVPEVGEANDVAFGADGTLYLASRDDNSLWVSTDDGATWDVRPVVGQPQDLAPAPDTPGLLVFATPQRVLRSDDGGQTFLDVIASGDRPPLADPHADGTFYLPASPPQVSRDGGLTWQALGAPPFAGAAVMAADPSTADRLFVADRDGRVAESVDGGLTWSTRGGAPGLDIPSAAIPALLYQPSSDRLLLGRGGLTRTTGLLERVTADAREEIRVAGAGAFRHVAVDGESIVAAAEDGVHVSDDAGASWSRGDPDVDGFFVDTVARGLDGTLWALLQEDGGSDTLLVASTDGGTTWSARGESVFDGATLSDPVPGEAAGIVRVVANFILGGGTSGIWRSDDGGMSWGIELLADPGVLRGMTAAPEGQGELWAFSRDGVLHKPFAGTSWGFVAGSPELVALAVGADDHLYGLVSDGVWISEDGGATARTVNLDARELSVAASSVDGRIAALTVLDGFVLTTDDAGRTWNRLPTDLASFPQGIAFGPQARRVWLPTAGSGLFSRRIAVDEPLALQGARFLAEVTWRAFDGTTGSGRAALRTDDTGTYWFFGPDNLELMVKVLDGRGVNNHWWVFYGASTNVEFTLTVTDRVTGEQSMYFNPLGTFASFGDTTAFEAIYPPRVGAGTTSNPGIAPGEPTPQLLLGDGRFRATVTWRDFDGDFGGGLAVPLADDTGAFWFFDDQNLELMVKVLDGRPVNGRFWVFFGSLSNVAFTLEIEDLDTGAVRRYENPLGTFASVGDVEAF